MSTLLSLLLAASIDGEAALRHASSLAALGPHPWGSPRDKAAALYVSAELRAAGIDEVEMQTFETGGLTGTNVIATLRAPGDEFVVVAAHHDTAPDSPGAYDDGGGVGTLIEVARVLAKEKVRTRTVVFASFDGEEAWATGKGETVGSRAYLARLQTRARSMVAAFAIEMSGWRKGSPLLHPVAYADPRAPGRQVTAPAWLVAAALAGSREEGAPFGVGDPILSWLYQPAVRTFRVRLYGDDLSFLQAGYPALFASDSSFSAFYPDYHRSTDVADRLDRAALERMGRAVAGVVRALVRAPRGKAEDRHWFAAFGRVFTWPWLVVLGALSVAPALRQGFAGSRPGLGLRLVQVALFGLLLWRLPVPALWVFLAPNVVLSWRRTRWTVLLASVPALSLVALGTAAWWRGAVSGVWLSPWEIAVMGLALALTLAGPGASTGRAGTSGRHRRGRR
jgi:hypothetical protein